MIDEDAKIISNLTGLKLTKLNNEIQKCGFPIVSIAKYTNILNHNNIKYKILENDDNYEEVPNEKDYINNITIKNIIEKIKNIDIYSINPRQALDIIEELQKEINDATSTK